MNHKGGVPFIITRDFSGKQATTKPRQP